MEMTQIWTKLMNSQLYLLGLFQRLVVHLQQNMIPCMENSFISSSSHNTRINHQMCLTYYCKYTFSKSIIKTSVSIHESNYFSLSRCSFSLWCTFIALKASIFALLMNTSLLTWSYNSFCNSCDLFLIFKIFHKLIPYQVYVGTLPWPPSLPSHAPVSPTSWPAPQKPLWWQHWSLGTMSNTTFDDKVEDLLISCDPTNLSLISSAELILSENSSY